MTISSTDLWTRLLEMPRAHKIVDFPRKFPDGTPMGQIAMMVLTQDEQMSASAETDAYTRKILKTLPKDGEAKRGYDDIYNNRCAIELLYRCCKKAEDPKSPFFPAPDLIQSKLTPDEVGVLVNTYMQVQVEVGPIMSQMSDEDVDAWIRRLRDGGSRVPLASLSLAALIDLAFTLACRNGSSPTDTSSAGSPPENTPENTSSSTPTSDDPSVDVVVKEAVPDESV
jgi:hypothetical protein